MFYMGHRRGRGEQGEQYTSLTGPVVVTEPPKEQKDLRARIASAWQSIQATLTVLPRVVHLVWEASPGLTIALAVATALLGLIPAVSAYVAKLLVDAVVHGIQVRANPALPDVATVGLPFVSWTVSTVGAIVVLAVVQFIVAAVLALFSTVRNVAQQLLQDRVSVTIQLQVMRHATKLDLAFFEDSASYDLLRRAQTEASSRPVFMVSGAFGLVQTLITFASMVALLIAVSPLLAIAAFISPIPAFIADTRFGWRGFQFARWTSPLHRRMEYLTTLVTRDTFAKEVKLFALGRFFTDRFELLARAFQARQQGLVTSRYGVGFALGLISTLAGSLTYLYVALQAIAGRLTIGDLTLYTQAASSVQGSVQGILQGFGSMYENQLYLSSLYDVLSTPPGIEATVPTRRLTRPVRGAIEFRDVTFRYPGSEADALSHLSFAIVPGETVAIVGRNGAGKTTLIRLLCRLYDPTEGSILVDGVDIRGLDPAELRQAIGAIFQDYVEYQATVAENIGLGELERIEDRRAVEGAASAAGAVELVQGLPSGFETPLGKWFDGGAELSGGEWQKVALSRAFMRASPILILDEPTSALDPQAEWELFARLRRLATGRTAIYISHRFSTVRQADRIFFLEHGTLVEQGTHEELLALGGRYARLFQLQASAYTGMRIDDEQLIEAAGGNGSDIAAPPSTAKGRRFVEAGERGSDEPTMIRFEGR